MCTWAHRVARSPARERPIPAWQRACGAPCPRPLRTDDQPEGIGPGKLTRPERTKVRKGNQIAWFCAHVAWYCLERGVWFAIKNPTNSILWKLPAYQELLQDSRVTAVDFHACMFGSKRDKKTTFVTNCGALEILRQKCDGSHEHAPWGLHWHKGWQFATEEECEYPKELCNAVAAAVAGAPKLPRPGAAPVRRKQKSRPGPLQTATGAAVGRQSKTHRHKQAIPVYKSRSPSTRQARRSELLIVLTY